MPAIYSQVVQGKKKNIHMYIERDTMKKQTGQNGNLWGIWVEGVQVFFE